MLNMYQVGLRYDRVGMNLRNVGDSYEEVLNTYVPGRDKIGG